MVTNAKIGDFPLCAHPRFFLLVMFIPKPLFQKLHFWLRTASGAFCPPAVARDFEKMQVTRTCGFSKTSQARRAVASVKRCSWGLGIFPQQAHL